MFAVNSVGVVLGVQSSSRLAKYIGPQWILLGAVLLMLAGHGGEAATAASVMGAVNFGSAGVISPIVGLFGVTSAVPMAGVMVCTSLVSLTVMWVIVRPRTVPALAR